jgi:hypothetical protein
VRRRQLKEKGPGGGAENSDEIFTKMNGILDKMAQVEISSAWYL